MKHSGLQLVFTHRNRLPVILQDEITECGYACIAMVCQFWGHAIDLFTLRNQFKPATQGMTLRHMHTIFAQYGFETRALQVPLSELMCIRKPAVLHWNMNHFVVLIRVKKRHVVIHDPACGVRYCTFEEVSRAFTGVVLEVDKPSKPISETFPKRLRLLDLIRGVRGLKPVLGLLLCLSLLIELLSLVSPLFMQQVTDHVIASRDGQNLLFLVLGFALLLIIQALTELLRGCVGLYVSMHLTEQFSAWCMRHLLCLPLSFFTTRRRGDIQSKMQAIHEIQRKVGIDFIQTLLDGCMAGFTLIVMWMFSALLTSIVLSALGVYSVIRLVAHGLLKRHTAASIHQHAAVASIFLETVQAIMPLKSFSKEQVWFNQWRNGLVDALNADIRLAKVQLLVQAIHQLLFYLEPLLLIAYGSLRILDNQLSIGMLLAFLGYRQLLVTKALGFIQNVFDYRLCSIQLNRLSDIVLHAPEAVSTGVGSVHPLQGKLSLRAVSFRYDAFSAWIIQSMDLTVYPGEKVVLVGPSGCGKSTVLKIMMGLIEPTEGNVWVDDQPLHAFGLQPYRQLIASVMQEDTLVNGSILDNIAFFDEAIDYDWVYTVAHLSGIHDTIRGFAMGYETRVGDMGSTLSGGQKQRILLARALYKKPKILFLDEATSHLDADNENTINQSLASLQITQILVAHRKETIQMADRVIQL